MEIFRRCQFLSVKASGLIRSTANPTVWKQPLRYTHDAATNEDPDMPIEMENPYKREKRLCILCKLDIEPDYKNVQLLSQFQSRFTGKIYGRHITGLCKEKQARLEQEILKAQNSGMMGYYTKDPSFVKDPALFDINNPFRPHKY